MALTRAQLVECQLLYSLGNICYVLSLFPIDSMSMCLLCWYWRQVFIAWDFCPYAGVFSFCLVCCATFLKRSLALVSRNHPSLSYNHSSSLCWLIWHSKVTWLFFSLLSCWQSTSLYKILFNINESTKPNMRNSYEVSVLNQKPDNTFTTKEPKQSSFFFLVVHRLSFVLFI